MHLQKQMSKKTCSKKNNSLLASRRSLTKEQDPDPLVRGTDPRIRIRTKIKMLQIRDTVVDVLQ